MARAHPSDLVVCPVVLPTSLPRRPTQTGMIDRDAWKVIVHSKTLGDPKGITLEEANRRRIQLSICRL